MQKWEHFEVTLFYGKSINGTDEGGWVLFMINGKDALPAYNEPARANGIEYITQLGKKGWELVGCSHIDNSCLRLIFKRPLVKFFVEETPMQKWEYVEISALGRRIKGTNNSEAAVDKINGEKQDLDKSPLFYEYVKQLGEEGWELVSCNQYIQWVFKRPKE